MSARLDFIDREKRVLWICFEGRGDELEANLCAYGVRYVPGFRCGRVGIEFDWPLEIKGKPGKPGTWGEPAESAVTIVEILTMRQGVTKRHEADFLHALGIVQQHQAAQAEAAS